MEFSELVGLARECKGSGNWTSASLIRVGGLLAGKINGIQNLSGPEKLKLIQRVLIQALAEAENKEIAVPELAKEEIQKINERYDVLENVVADALPASLELAINAARGRLDLKKVKPSTWVKVCSCVGIAVVHQLASMNLITEAHANQARRAIEVVQEKAEAVAKAKEAEVEPPKPSQESAPVEEKKETELAPAVEVVAEGTSQ
jgi:hypothetical protein